jgi:hypothetical protein
MKTVWVLCFFKNNDLGVVSISVTHKGLKRFPFNNKVSYTKHIDFAKDIVKQQGLK